MKEWPVDELKLIIIIIIICVTFGQEIAPDSFLWEVMSEQNLFENVNHLEDH